MSQRCMADISLFVFNLAVPVDTGYLMIHAYFQVARLTLIFKNTNNLINTVKCNL